MRAGVQAGMRACVMQTCGGCSGKHVKRCHAGTRAAFKSVPLENDFFYAPKFSLVFDFQTFIMRKITHGKGYYV